MKEIAQETAGGKRGTRPRRRSTGPLPEVEYDGALHLAGTVLWFDSARREELAFVSHAHLDHLASHRKILASEPTVKLCRHRMGPIPALVCPFRRPFAMGRLEIELFPAGHILGSAQIRVRTDKGDVVYTGELNLVPSRTAERATVVPCDVLVIDATYGHPKFRFPPRAEVETCVVEFAQSALAGGATPVFLAYTMGKAQEVLQILGGAGVPVRMHREAHELSRVYRECGVTLPPSRAMRGPPSSGEAILVPPDPRGLRALGGIREARVAMLTGWAVDPAFRPGMPCDTTIPLSDHADFEALIQYVEIAHPKRIYTVSRHAREFADLLRERGWKAEALASPRQLEMFS